MSWLAWLLAPAVACSRYFGGLRELGSGGVGGFASARTCPQRKLILEEKKKRPENQIFTFALLTAKTFGQAMTRIVATGYEPGSACPCDPGGWVERKGGGQGREGGCGEAGERTRMRVELEVETVRTRFAEVYAGTCVNTGMLAVELQFARQPNSWSSLALPVF